MASKNFKVIIVGGSIAGLSLALMLEKNGIDFVVLEGYPDIAPQVGASIGVLPNGLRVLDQLGCYEKVIEMAEYPVKKVLFRDSQGRPFWSFEDFHENICERHGYPIVFFDRRMLIQILHDAIRDKSKILTSQRVMNVHNDTSGVTVTTETGQSFVGDIVVGTDGIHSKVRQEMWEESRKTDPNWIDSSEDQAVPATWACIFGISEGIQGFEKGTLTSVFNEHFSYLIPSGPGDRTYWFLVSNLGKTVYGKDIPRFTKEDEEELVKEHLNDHLTPTVRFSDLYKHKIASVYTSLPEYVYKRWYFQRIITIGDASHKLEPLTGQGGNSAIETAASLANHLVAAFERNPDRRLSTEDISNVFASVQQRREGRAWELVRAAHARQRLECMETPLLKFIAKWVIPYFPKGMLMDRWIQTYSPAVSLDMLPQPNRKHTILYHDELLRPPKPRGIFGILLYIAYLLLAFTAFRLLLLAGKANGTWSLVREGIMAQLIPDVGVQLRQRYTGIEAIDSKLRLLVLIFFPAVTGVSGPEQPLQLLYFLLAMLPLVSIITVEGFRSRNKWTLLALPSLWGALYQLRGIGFIAPLYFLSSTFVSRNAPYFLPARRTIPTPAAKAFLPALIAGFIIPTMLLFFPIEDQGIRQAAIAFWQPAPVYVAVLSVILSHAIRVGHSSGNQKTRPQDPNTDIPYLQTVYQVTGIISACFHLTTILGCLLSPTLSLTKIFLPGDSFAPVARLSDGIFIFLQNDLLLVTVSSLLWCFAITAAGVIASLSVTVGPGATIASVWYWRESVMKGAFIQRRGKIAAAS
ncbi:hypothetical protein PVAR5_1548 [Paecilomyces variotii No. 5]|uniref:FAD-binding domain-containing protein n=1 Tax=Byssochlamys spectabilis (strain No. 5 / NBRC 109023) TaxID=1356009 RepID=V5F9R8_BYSSN|nr:hypothetical protein PVAR5_1548 [Paecilomyces variotii No. 5]